MQEQHLNCYIDSALRKCTLDLNNAEVTIENEAEIGAGDIILVEIGHDSIGEGNAARNGFHIDPSKLAITLGVQLKVTDTAGTTVKEFV